MIDLPAIVWQVIVGAAILGLCLLVLASLVMAFEYSVNGGGTWFRRTIGRACVFGWILFACWGFGLLFTSGANR